MIAHKVKVILGIVIAIFIVMAFPSFASNVTNLNPLDYPFYVQASIAQTSSGSFSFVPIIPYRDGNSFYLPNFPYERNVQFTFTFSDYTILNSYINGYYRPDSSPASIATSAPSGADAESTLPINISSLELEISIFESYNTGGADISVHYSDILETGSDGKVQIKFLTNGSASSSLANFDEAPVNPFSFYWTSLTGGIDGVERLLLNFRFKGYPTSGYFAPNIIIRFDKFIINGVNVADEQIITELNNEMASIFQRLSDYSLEHLTDVSLSDAFNNIDYAADTLENTRFRAIFDSFYGYGIIPTLIVLSLSIAFLGYLLYGKSG